MRAVFRCLMKIRGVHENFSVKKTVVCGYFCDCFNDDCLHVVSGSR